MWCGILLMKIEYWLTISVTWPIPNLDVHQFCGTFTHLKDCVPYCVLVVVSYQSSSVKTSWINFVSKCGQVWGIVFWNYVVSTQFPGLSTAFWPQFFSYLHDTAPLYYFLQRSANNENAGAGSTRPEIWNSWNVLFIRSSSGRFLT